MQLAEDVKAYVYVETAEGGKIVRSKSANRVALHAGQWVASLPAASAGKSGQEKSK